MSDIGIMGGTFDPIHNGHLLLGRQACEEYHLDQIWYMPSGQPPHKADHHIASAQDRCAMIQLAIRDISDFVCSDFETRRPGITYSSETLTLLNQMYPSHHFYFIIGEDSYFEIEHWHHPWEVMKLATLLVARREYAKTSRTIEEHRDYLRKKYQADIHFLHCRELDVASSELRRLIAEGKDIHDLIPPAVAEYIHARNLYH